jgi:carboxypeptidase Taq
MNEMEKNYKKFLEHFHKINTLNQILQLLSWDQETMMPEQAASMRAEQMAYLSAESHKLLTDSKYIEIMQSLLASNELDSKLKAAIKKHLRDSQNASKLPQSLVVEMSKASVTAQQAWKEARKKDDFSLFKNELKKMFDLKKEQGKCLKTENQTIYEALLSEYEPDFPVSYVRDLFNELKKNFVPLVPQMIEKNQSEVNLNLFLSLDKQKKFNEDCLSKIGFDLKRGRLDIAAHPFCSGQLNDVRLTTRYEENDWSNSLYSVLHEGGHGLYEQGIGEALENSPLAFATSLGMHESQSRFWENCIGRSFEFCKWVVEYVSKNYGVQKVNPADFYKHVNKPKYSYIRVEADEVTYNLHIMVRFDVEEALIEDKVKVEDVPAFWDQKYKEYLSLPRKNDADGVLQDVHWSCGGIGYFPTYTIGNLISAQILKAMERDLNVKNLVENGDFLPIREWLYKKIHSFGCEFSTLNLVEKSTGQKLGAQTWIDLMKSKFL